MHGIGEYAGKSGFLEELHKLNEQYLDEERLGEQANFNHRTLEQIEACKKQIAEYQKKISECSGHVKALYADKTKSIITEDEFVELSHGFHADKEHLSKLVVDTQKQIAVLQKKLEQSDNIRALVRQYTDAEHLTREMVDILIDHIEVGQRIPKTRQRPINIYWNF